MIQVAFKAPQCFAFVKESNAIESIFRNPTREELEATDNFIFNKELTLETVCNLQKVYAPDKPLRKTKGMGCRVGYYTPPAGGPEIVVDLENILSQAREDLRNPYEIHMAFELLHPFLDGNGRTGRALWAWKMVSEDRDPFDMPFLQRFYYQTLGYNSHKENHFLGNHFLSFEIKCLKKNNEI